MTSHIVDVSGTELATEIASSKKTLLVVFSAPWCGPCKAMTPALDALAKERSDQVRVLKVNVDENKEIAQHLAIRAVPTLLVYKDGVAVATKTGAQSRSQLETLIA